MKTIQRACSVAIIALICAACGSGTDTDTDAKPPPAPQDTVVADQMRAIERAKSVEATTMQGKQAIDRALEDAEGSTEQ